MSAPSRPAPSSRAVWLLAAAGLALRLWGLRFGLPGAFARPDEEQVLRAVLSTAVTGNPHFFYYPSLVFDADALLVRAAQALGLLGADLRCTAAASPQTFFLLFRTVSALCGALAVVPIARVAARIAGEAQARSAAVAAAAFAALAYLPVRESHFGVTDAPLLLLLAIGLERATALVVQPSWSNFLLAGAAWGLATSAKYNGLGLGVALAVACAMVLVDQRSAWPRALAMVGAAAVAFALTSPFFLVDFARAWPQFLTNLTLVKQGFAGFEMPPAPAFYAGFALPWGLGAPLCLLALLGLPRLARGRVGLPVLLYGVAAALSIGLGKYVLVRYALVVVPVLLASAGTAVAWGVGQLPSRVAAGVALLAVLPAAARSVALDVALSRDDTRTLAARWLGRLPAGTSIATEGYFGAPQLVGQPVGAGCRDAPRGLQVWNVNRYQPAATQQQWVNQLFASPPQYVVEREGALRWYGHAAPWVGLLLRTHRYVEVAHFDAPLEGPAAFDDLDAFFLPYDHPLAQARPGPTVRIWARPSP